MMLVSVDEIYLHSLAKYFLDMTDVFCSAHQMMRPGAYAFYVVGNNSTTINGEQRIEIPTNEFLWQIGKRVGWIGEQRVEMEILPSRDVFRRNSGSQETILVFKARKHVGSPSKEGYLQSESSLICTIKMAPIGISTQQKRSLIYTLYTRIPARFIPQIPRKAIEEWSKKRRGDFRSFLWMWDHSLGRYFT